jgi:hypothetical protein
MRERAQLEMLAWHACHFVNCFSKKRITPKQLLPRPGVVSADGFDNPEDFIAAVEAARKGGEQ